MDIGEMNDRVSIISTALVDIGHGDYTRQETDLGEIWAKVEQMDSENLIKLGISTGARGYKIIIRLDNRIDENSRVIYKGEELSVTGVVFYENQEYMEIIAKK